MDGKRKNNTRRVFMFAGLLILMVIGGMVLLSKRSKPESSVPGQANFIPVIVDAGLPDSSGAGTEDDKYAIHIGLSDGQSQPQRVETFPLATGEPLSSEEIELILARLPTQPSIPGEQTEFKLPQEVILIPRQRIRKRK